MCACAAHSKKGYYGCVYERVVGALTHHLSYVRACALMVRERRTCRTHIAEQWLERACMRVCLRMGYCVQPFKMRCARAQSAHIRTENNTSAFSVRSRLCINCAQRFPLCFALAHSVWGVSSCMEEHIQVNVCTRIVVYMCSTPP